MDYADIQELALALSRNRQHGTVTELLLGDLASDDEADAVLVEAMEHRDSPVCGYAVVATSVLTQRLLRCPAPVYSPLLDSDILVEGRPFHLPHGVVGAGAGHAFVMGRLFPEPGENITAETARSAISACRLAIGVLGRRVPNHVALNPWSVAADFGLTVGYAFGPMTAAWEELDLAAGRVDATMDDQHVASGAGSEVMGHPLAVVAWLAKALAARDRQLTPNDIVVVGSCVGILQVLPGQRFGATAAGLGAAHLSFA